MARAVRAAVQREPTRAAARARDSALAGTSGTQRGSLVAPNLPVYRTTGQARFARYRLDGTRSTERPSPTAALAHVTAGLLLRGPVRGAGRIRRSRRSASAGPRRRPVSAPGRGRWRVLRAHRRRQLVPRGDAAQRCSIRRAGSWGAFELTARVQPAHARRRRVSDLCQSGERRARRRARGALGTNWYLNRGGQAHGRLRRNPLPGRRRLRCPRNRARRAHADSVRITRRLRHEARHSQRVLAVACRERGRVAARSAGRRAAFTRKRPSRC